MRMNHLAWTRLVAVGLVALGLAGTASAEKNTPSSLFAPAATHLLTSGGGVHVRVAERAYGTEKAIRLFKQAVAKVKVAIPGTPDLMVGDLSFHGGGRMKPHRSHRDGRDMDVSYYFKDGKARKWFERATLKNLDVKRTWAFISALLDTGEVQYIFIQSRLQKVLYAHALKTGTSKATLDRLFQWPRGRRNKRGVIRHERGHDDHIHIRFTDR